MVFFSKRFSFVVILASTFWILDSCGGQVDTSDEVIGDNFTDTFGEKTQAAVNAKQTTYIYAGAMRIAREDSLGNRTYMHQDHLSSVSLETDGAGVQTELVHYTPFGEPLSATSVRYLYNGKERENGVYDYHFRHYDAGKLNRFMKADDFYVPQDPQSLDPYAYTENNPIFYSDPSGHCRSDGIGKDGNSEDCPYVLNDPVTAETIGSKSPMTGFSIPVLQGMIATDRKRTENGNDQAKRQAAEQIVQNLLAHVRENYPQALTLYKMITPKDLGKLSDDWINIYMLRLSSIIKYYEKVKANPLFKTQFNAKLNRYFSQYNASITQKDTVLTPGGAVELGVITTFPNGTTGDWRVILQDSTNTFAKAHELAHVMLKAHYGSDYQEFRADSLVWFELFSK